MNNNFDPFIRRQIEDFHAHISDLDNRFQEAAYNLERNRAMREVLSPQELPRRSFLQTVTEAAGNFLLRFSQQGGQHYHNPKITIVDCPPPNTSDVNSPHPYRRFNDE